LVRLPLHPNVEAKHSPIPALGEAVGTGLLIGSGAGLAQCGPVALLTGYIFVGLLCNIVLNSLGEMTTWLPLGSSSTGYATRFVDPTLGFALGWMYLFKYIIATANQYVS
jgi:amino acid transporter